MQTSGINSGIYVAFSSLSGMWSVEQVSSKISSYNPSVCMNKNGEGFITYAEDGPQPNPYGISSLFKRNFSIVNGSLAMGAETPVNQIFTINGSYANQATPITQINSDGNCLVFSIGNNGLTVAYGPFQDGPLQNINYISAYVGVGSPPSETFCRFNINQSQLLLYNLVN